MGNHIQGFVPEKKFGNLQNSLIPSVQCPNSSYGIILHYNSTMLNSSSQTDKPNCFYLSYYGPNACKTQTRLDTTSILIDTNNKSTIKYSEKSQGSEAFLVILHNCDKCYFVERKHFI